MVDITQGSIDDTDSDNTIFKDAHFVFLMTSSIYRLRRTRQRTVPKALPSPTPTAVLHMGITRRQTPPQLSARDNGSPSFIIELINNTSNEDCSFHPETLKP